MGDPLWRKPLVPPGRSPLRGRCGALRERADRRKRLASGARGSFGAAIRRADLDAAAAQPGSRVPRGAPGSARGALTLADPEGRLRILGDCDRVEKASVAGSTTKSNAARSNSFLLLTLEGDRCRGSLLPKAAASRFLLHKSRGIRDK